MLKYQKSWWPWIFKCSFSKFIPKWYVYSLSSCYHALMILFANLQLVIPTPNPLLYWHIIGRISGDSALYISNAHFMMHWHYNICKGLMVVIPTLIPWLYNLENIFGYLIFLYLFLVLFLARLLFTCKL